MSAPAASRAGRNGMRPATDFYPTPPAATRALLGVERFEGAVWECACGDGAMARVLAAHGLEVVATDLNGHGYGEAGVDFLMETRLLAPNIVTNPPYRLANAFVRHALWLGAERVAMLLRLAFLEGSRRADIIERGGLARVHVFRDRLTMSPKGSGIDKGGAIAFAWFVWQRGHAGPPELSRISRVE